MLCKTPGMADPSLVSVAALLAGLNSLWSLSDASWAKLHPNPELVPDQNGLQVYYHPASIHGGAQDASVYAEFRDHHLVQLWVRCEAHQSGGMFGKLDTDCAGLQEGLRKSIASLLGEAAGKRSACFVASSAESVGELGGWIG